MSRKSGDRFSEPDMRKRKNLSRSRELAALRNDGPGHGAQPVAQAAQLRIAALAKHHGRKPSDFCAPTSASRSTRRARPSQIWFMKPPSGEHDSIASMPPSANSCSVILSTSSAPGENFANSDIECGLPGIGGGAAIEQHLRRDRAAVDPQQRDRRTTLRRQVADQAAREGRIFLVAEQRGAARSPSSSRLPS